MQNGGSAIGRRDGYNEHIHTSPMAQLAIPAGSGCGGEDPADAQPASAVAPANAAILPSSCILMISLPSPATVLPSTRGRRSNPPEDTRCGARAATAHHFVAEGEALPAVLSGRRADPTPASPIVATTQRRGDSRPERRRLQLDEHTPLVAFAQRTIPFGNKPGYNPATYGGPGGRQDESLSCDIVLRRRDLT
jgi:hypothetical protein